jgi:antitoxin component YwqK of YwqJK toxin-antitoxin module
MPKLRVQRFYYRNGQIRLENREVDGGFHGLCRTWHYNGQLAEELRYRHGKLHGVSRQWNENGRLLGSFTMNHGTGRQQYWHNNGKLRLEINSFNGKFFGRMRLWLRDGTLVQETYYISNVDVTRAAYLKAARKHPDWPQHEGEPAGKVAVTRGRP